MTYTRQEIFDRCWNGLASQGWKPSLAVDRTMCCYRGAEGRQCNVGRLIPDELYDPRMEGYGASYLFCAWPDVAALFDPKDVQFVEHLQCIHDAAVDEPENHRAEEMRRRMESFAEKHNLTIPVTRE